MITHFAFLRERGGGVPHRRERRRRLGFLYISVFCVCVCVCVQPLAIWGGLGGRGEDFCWTEEKPPLSVYQGSGNGRERFFLAKFKKKFHDTPNLFEKDPNSSPPPPSPPSNPFFPKAGFFYPYPEPSHPFRAWPGPQNAFRPGTILLLFFSP